MFTPPPRVDSPEFTLRAWSVEDTPALRKALQASETHLRAFTPWVVDSRVPGLPLEERLRQHADAFATGKEWVYGIFSLTDGEVLGAVGLYPRVGPGAIEIGYWVAVTHTGRGLATRASEILTRIAFTDPTIDRVEIHCDVENMASNAVPRRIGYSSAPSESAPPGLTIWALTRAEYMARGGTPPGNA